MVFVGTRRDVSLTCRNLSNLVVNRPSFCVRDLCLVSFYSARRVVYSSCNIVIIGGVFSEIWIFEVGVGYELIGIAPEALS